MGSTPIPGSKGQTHVTPLSPQSPAAKERVFKTLWSMKNYGYYETTMTYHRTKDILYTQRQLGHRNIKNTLVYTHLIQFSSEDFVCKVATTVKEACNLVEEGFDYVTDMEGVEIFRKRK